MNKKITIGSRGSKLALIYAQIASYLAPNSDSAYYLLGRIFKSIDNNERAIKYSFEREAFSKPINQFQGVSFKLSDMAVKIQASKHLVYHAAWKKDQGLDIVKEAAMAKLFSSEVAMKTTTDSIQVHGGYGYVKDYDVERYFRDSKILEIGVGTSEIQRLIISREILKTIETVV